MTTKRIVIGTRGSRLALWQTNHVVEKLRQLYPDKGIAIKEIKTQGDVAQNVPFSQVGRTGIFIKELESALLSGEIDLAVHSLKDLPSQVNAGFALPAVLEREDPRDVLVSRLGLPLDKLPPGARIGTGSPRRGAQVRAFRPDLQICLLRGNVDTRLRKAASEDYEGAILAAAGIKRLGRDKEITQYLSLEICLPAVGQGAMAVETRADDTSLIELVAALDHPPTNRATAAERALLKYLGGGCQVPIAAYGEVDGERLRLRAMVASPNGARLLRAEGTGPAEAPEELGRKVGDKLLALGAAELLEEA